MKCRLNTTVSGADSQMPRDKPQAEKPAQSGPNQNAVHHYTNKTGYNAITATPEWMFKANRPPAPEHEFGAYFTTYGPNEPNLSNKIRVPKKKLEFMFTFVDAGDLLTLRGWRGRGIFYSRTDYCVPQARQVFHGPREARA